MIDRTHLCGYDLNLTYPQAEPFAPINNTFDFSSFGVLPRDPRKVMNRKKVLKSLVSAKSAVQKRDRAPWDDELVKREEKRRAWKRDLTGRANGTIDPFYGCFLLEETIDYALNFSFPWSE